MHTEKLARIKPLLWSLVWLGIILFVFFFMVSNVLAQEPTPVGPVQNTGITDDQVNAIAKQMFCPVCENIPLDVCPTQACEQWRELIREKLAAGWGEKQIKNYFVDQYGERVLGAPPAQGINWLVYIVPPIAILAGLFILYKALRLWKPTAIEKAIESLQAGPINEAVADAGNQAARSMDPEVDEYVRRLEEELRKRE